IPCTLTGLTARTGPTSPECPQAYTMFESSTKKASIPLGLSSCEEPILPYFCGEALQRSEPQASRKGAKHAKVDVIWCGNEWYADLMQSKLRRNLTQRRKARKEECLSLDLS